MEKRQLKTEYYMKKLGIEYQGFLLFLYAQK